MGYSGCIFYIAAEPKPKRNMKISILISILFASLTSFSQPGDSIYKFVKYRNIGPFRGGRSVTATGVTGDPLTYYMGTTGGGLWKTSDAGQRWDNISDGYFKTGSVGAVSVSPSHPNIVYCGMGEHAPRGVMTSYGDGVYKSTDAGKSWVKIGLENTQHISRIIIHPDNPDIVYVAAQGALYGPNQERGIFKTIDGGQTWERILFINELTGCSELSIDKSNPEVLYAAMWEHQRLPWKVVSGGKGSGLYKSVDAGKNWTRLEKGLPSEMGKMAIAVSQSNSDKVYALIESDWEKEAGGLYLSNDAGKSWRQITNEHRLIQRAWYYIELFIDPQDEHTIYVLSAPALLSIDGGKTWERITGTHGDFHDLWINPMNPDNMVIANDGGAAISFNKGKTWSTQSNMPTAQFYRVSVDNLYPYNIYGGQQDNSSVKIASMSPGSYSIDEKDWESSAGGESAFLAFDPDNPRFVMGGSYLGTIELLDTQGKAGTKIMAAPIQYLGREARDMKYLFNWNAPIIRSQHEPNTFYHGAQVLLKTTDMGKTWTEASPDLTRNIDEKQGNGGGPYTNEAVGAENYGTISYVIESPHDAGVIWTGSDDGKVYMTNDNGENWNDVTPKNLGETLVNAIEISPHDPGTIYIATTRFKFNDYTPAIYKTTNNGKTWTNISAGIPQGAFTRVIREDSQQKDLLFAGTETGMYISRNGGKSWSSFQLNLPVVPITDLQVKHGDLIVATMGRSFWILDDLELIRQRAEMESDLKLYKPENIVLGNWGSPLNQSDLNFKGTNPFSGVNPANGVVIYYNLPEVSKDSQFTLEIKNANGNVVRTLSSKPDKNYKSYAGGPPADPVLPAKKGLNRFVWDMRHPIMKGAPTAYIEGSFRGHKAIPGKYEIIIKLENITKQTQFEILPNPTYQITMDEYNEFDVIMNEMEANLNAMHEMVNSLILRKTKIEKVLSENEEIDNSLKEKLESLVQKITAWDTEMIQRKSKAYDDVENFPNKFTANYLFLINQSESSIPRINKPNIDRKKELDTQWKVLQQRGFEILNIDIPEINKLLWENGIGAI